MRIANHDGRTVVLTSDTGGFDVAKASCGRFGPDIQSLYEKWDAFVAWAAEASGPSLEIDTSRLGPVTPRPLQSFGIGLNYDEHVAESGLARPDRIPPVFPKFQSSITGPYETVELAPGGRPTGKSNWCSSSGVERTGSKREPDGNTSLA